MAHSGSFVRIVSIENLFLAWSEFRRGKRNKPDVQEFEFGLEQNIFALHEALVNGTYRHGTYKQFRITDPKSRLISKASVRDRLLHHAIYRVLYPLFDETFIFDSYSCRNNKGTHKAFLRLAKYARTISKNYTGPCFALKCDIRKFFDSIDHQILIDLLTERIADQQLLDLLINIITSFAVTPGAGIPLGNLTSQLFANVYMDPLDKFVKHTVKVRYYLRYADDFVLLGVDMHELLQHLIAIQKFLKEHLRLSIHPNKITLQKLEWGIDFVGYVALPHYEIPRTKTVKRIMRRIEQYNKSDPQMLAKAVPSYLGYLQHVRAHQVSEKIISQLLGQDQCHEDEFVV